MVQQKRRKPRKTARFLNMLLLVFAFLVVFEGRLIINIASKGGLNRQVDEQLNKIFSSSDFQNQDEATAESETSSESASKYPANVTPFVNGAGSTSTSSVTVDDRCIVKKQTTPVDDSFISDAEFIGDSRVEGFHMQSGITQGTFLTGVGMNCTDIFETPYISTASGNVTVIQALKNNSFKKMYIMIGTNDLGYPDFEEFRKNYTKCLAELRKLMPNAIFYVSAVPYVEEAKVQTGDYVNYTNFFSGYKIILEFCSANGYYYLNPNEVLSNGNGALAADATSDGIHMYPEYCAKWLDYLLTHYVTAVSSSSVSDSDSASESETASGASL